jgi:hypothetical protein
MRLPLVGPLARPEPVVPGQDPVLVPSGRISMLEETRKVEHMSKFISREEEADGIPFKDEIPPWERVIDGDEQLNGLPEKFSEHQNNKKKLENCAGYIAKYLVQN